MRVPLFWLNPPDRPGWQARMLAPAAALLRVMNHWRARRARPCRAPVPVICVGSLAVGGAGKTPMVAALVSRLIAQGRTPHIVSRGRGGTLAGPQRVDPLKDTHAEVGDEPLMLAALAPAWVARDRAAGLRAAAEAGAGLILLDGGFQDPGVAPDRTILMIDAAQGLGNGRLYPAGPLREPAAEGLARADLVVLLGSAVERRAARERWPELAAASPLDARLRPRETGLSLDGETVVAFAGISRPGRFFATLAAMGARIAATIAFADHCAYPPPVLRRLKRRAEAEGAMLVTTEKDAARLPSFFLREVVVVQVYLDLDDWAPVDAILSLGATSTEAS